jgi:hypothetical protein
MVRSTLPLFAFALLASAPALVAQPVAVPQFRSVELHGGGTVLVAPGAAETVTIVQGSTQFTRMYVDNEGKLIIDACNEQCPRNYQLRVEVRSPVVPPLAVHGGGAITTVPGFAPQAQIAVAVRGGGKIDARSVDAATVAAAVNGGGELLVRPRRSLAAAVNGGGNIRYWGNPSVSMAVRGGGAVTPEGY